MIAPTYYTLCAVNFFFLKDVESQFKWEKIVRVNVKLDTEDRKASRFWLECIYNGST